MKKFIQRALEKINKMDKEQIGSILHYISAENELLKMVLDSMTDGLAVCDRENRILRINKSFERLIPLFEVDFTEQALWEVISDREIATFLKDTLENQEKVMDVEFALESGVTRTISCSIMPLVREGKVQGSLIHVEEVTEKRSKEARLRRAESLAALTTLAAGVAHEIKNPLGSIGIHLQLAQKEIGDKTRVQTREIKKYLAVIQEEVDRLNRIVVDFLFTVRPMDTQLVERDVNQVVLDLLNFMKFELREAEVKLVTHLAENLPKMRLDERYLKQALLNLIKNSLSAMPNGGKLTIETSARSDEIFVKVIDNGIGIPENQIEKIFEPYYTTKDFGTGLGLTLVYKIVKEHLGEISVQSKEGEGSMFILSFPIPQHEKRLIRYEGEAV